jgi:D-alanine transaminase
VIIVESGVLIRRPAGPEVLPGTTTDAIFTAAAGAGLACRDEMISEQRLREADEIWIAAATRGITPVLELDGKKIGDGHPGPVWRQVAAAFEALKPHGTAH